MIQVGTSGYSYKEWKGSFYPDDLPADQMLRFYARHLGAVEINNTFYRMPRRSMLEKWALQVPDGFQFVLKAPQRITHRERLRDSGESVAFLMEQARALGDKLGPILFQTPPNLRADVDLLRAFLAVLPDGQRAAFELRHESWATDEVRDVLREHNAALCTADTEDTDEDEPIVATADWGYLRLRRCDYTDDDLARWRGHVAAQPGWRDAYVFFKHEDGGVGPAFAQKFAKA